MASQRFKLLLAGSYNTRIQVTNVLATSSGIVGMGIVGVMIVGLTGTVANKDQRFINCFVARVNNVYTGKTTLYLIKRPGFASALTPQAGSVGNAILIWTGSGSKIISAFGATNSSIYDSASQLVTNNGTTSIITGKARSITETVLSGTATLTIASSDSTGWYYQPAGTVTKISDGDFPGNNSLVTAGGFAHLDGYAFIATTDGRLWNSDVNSVTSWGAGSVLTANSYPDAGIAAVRKGDKIMYFGTESIQFFFNQGNGTGSPLSRVEPLTLRVGCVGADAIAEIGNDIFWVGSSPQGGIGVYQYTSGFTKISTPEIDTILLLAGASNISLTSTMYYGRYHLMVVAGAICFSYCVEEKGWSELAGTGAIFYKCAGVSSGSTQVTYAISKSSTSGKVFTINPASMTYQDNGEIYSATVRTSLIGEGNVRTFWHELEIIGDQQTSSSPLDISCSDDDYNTFHRLGTVDLMDARPRLTRCGSSFRRAYALSNSANTPMRLELLAGRSSTE